MLDHLKTCLSLPKKVETTFLATIVANLYLSLKVTACAQRTTNTNLKI